MTPNTWVSSPKQVGVAIHNPVLAARQGEQNVPTRMMATAMERSKMTWRAFHVDLCPTQGVTWEMSLTHWIWCMKLSSMLLSDLLPRNTLRHTLQGNVHDSKWTKTSANLPQLCASFNARGLLCFKCCPFSTQLKQIGPPLAAQKQPCWMAEWMPRHQCTSSPCCCCSSKEMVAASDI